MNGNVGRILLSACLASVIATFGMTYTAEAEVVATPSVVHFPPASVGGFSYQTVSITNTSGTDSEVITSVSAAPDYFFPTFGGTCFTLHGSVIPPATSCTVEFGFNPTNIGGQAAFGVVTLATDSSLVFILEGTGTGGSQGCVGLAKAMASVPSAAEPKLNQVLVRHCPA
jgi:hypothetical protein